MDYFGPLSDHLKSDAEELRIDPSIEKKNKDNLFGIYEWMSICCGTESAKAY